ncbi:hypothetical protein EJ997_10155 [Flaviflexus ciconiae]|uniref:Uncharacterized protein n=1 Tax=Flaviflexus ciconiae TaxID=2496867 RepID=A0A3S9PZ50_9ACTO|nr:hypothetical protein [Flaviflexus ciconiae]AZQ77645.1 hypothetical protein EJ997_10155 [Flaviflexus ciconiae]
MNTQLWLALIITGINVACTLVNVWPLLRERRARKRVQQVISRVRSGLPHITELAEAHHAGDVAKADQIRTHLANEHGIHVGELPGEEV